MTVVAAHPNSAPNPWSHHLLLHKENHRNIVYNHNNNNHHHHIHNNSSTTTTTNSNSHHHPNRQQSNFSLRKWHFLLFRAALGLVFVVLVWLQYQNREAFNFDDYSIDPIASQKLDIDIHRVVINNANSSSSSSSSFMTDNNNNKYNVESLSTKSKSTKLSLRYDWSNLHPSLELTRLFVAHQSNCSMKQGTFLYRNRYGMGSDLHMWGQALCNGVAVGLRLRSIGNWTWLDQQSCSVVPSPMTCYFPLSELRCSGDVDYAMNHPNFDPQYNLSRANGNVREWCQENITKGMLKSYIRTAGIEYLFTNVSPLVIQEAERQLNLVFHGQDHVPKDLITVHIRWGDKNREMKLATAAEYVEAIHTILDLRKVPTHDKANIYLATEDPAAVKAFQDIIPSGWNIFLDQFYTDMLPHRIDAYNGSPKMAKKLNGKAGLVTLGSLLVAMEANDFVLTTNSNWSRLMNELRKSIIDSRCGNCTNMIDLRPPKGDE